MKGNYGIPMNSTIHLKKAKPILCDCSLCYYSKRTYWGELYCYNRDIFNPKENKCKFYWRTRSPKKSQKANKIGKCKNE